MSSSSFAKQKLKAAKEAIAKHDWVSVKGLAEQIHEYEPENYTAWVFLGLAENNRLKTEDSEVAYLKATSISPEIPTAWQGLASLYTKLERWDELDAVIGRLVDIFDKLEDPIKLGEQLQKKVDLARAHLSRPALLASLALLLPDAWCNGTLSLIPLPEPTAPGAVPSSTAAVQHAVHTTEGSLEVLEEIVAGWEKQELEERTKEIDKRRLRLGGGRAKTRAQIEREVFAELGRSSRLPALYEQLLNHPALSVDRLRAVEHALLVHHRTLLFAIPSKEKDIKRAEREKVQKLGRGVVLIRGADRDAWDGELEWADWTTIDEYPLSDLKAFIKLFPEEPLTWFLQGYLLYFGLQDAETDESTDGVRAGKPKKKSEKPQAEENEAAGDDAFKLLFDGIDASPSSLLAHRILSHILLLEGDFASAISLCNAGLALLTTLVARTGLTFSKSELTFKTTLGAAYTHFYSPKHHKLAEPLLREVLDARPDDVIATLSLGHVLAAQASWEDAMALFDKAAAAAEADDTPAGQRRLQEAREESAWCKAKSGRVDEGRVELEAILSELDAEAAEGAVSSERDATRGARVAWRLGSCLADLSGNEPSQAAHDLYLSALKRSSSFAPAFTSLGIYYASLSPPDTVRSSRCLQRAFELDARQGEAARRLADNFADDKEWELVEIIAKRAIEGEGGLEGGLESKGSNEREREAKGRFLVENIWAWKALGAVELTRSSYAKAIHHFQVALRCEPSDVSSWLRLSEAYAHSGKQAAALKTLARAQELEPTNWVVNYMRGDVHSQLSSHAEAIACFEQVLATRPTEIGVLVSLSRTLVAQAREQSVSGYHARAEASLLGALAATWTVLDSSSGFGSLAWKNVGDACIYLAQLAHSFDGGRIAAVVRPFVQRLAADDQSGQASVADVVSARQIAKTPAAVDAPYLLKLAVCAYACRDNLLMSDDKLAAASLHDIAIALHHLAGSLPYGQKELQSVCVRQATAYVRSALRFRPKDEQLWTTLGTIVFESSPNLSQHAFIMALEINPKNPVVWSNLGFLYLTADDMELAAQAFLKSQTLDPDCALAWMGQGLLALKAKATHEASLMFEHAADLSSNALLEADLLFSLTTHSLFSTDATRPTDASLHGPAFVLQRYTDQRPSDASALHLHALILERLGSHEPAVAQLARCVAVLETAYEESEDPLVERKFAIAQSNLGRLQLAVDDSEAALEAFAGALGLAGTDDTSAEATALRVHAHFGSGLAHYWKGELDETLGSFQSALDELDARPIGHAKDKITVLLAQALWDTGGEEEMEAAKSTLLDTVTADSDNLQAVIALAAMGSISQDEGLVEAALAEVLAKPLDVRERLGGQDLDRFLIQHHLGNGDAGAARTVLTQAIHLRPGSVEPLSELARLFLQEGNVGMGRKMAQAAVDADRHLETGWKAALLRSVAALTGGDALLEGETAEEVHAKRAEALREAQRVLLSRPFDSDAWRVVELARQGQQAA